jgi:pimeloyl-ACP methyl ester carboxylesterase
MPHAIVNGISMYYDVHGSGYPLVFVSGTGGTHHSWLYYQVPFFKQYYTCIVSDHRGLGQTDAPDEHYSTRGFAADQIGLLKALGIERTHIMGHSMGGRVCQWMALDHPEMIQSMVLSGSGSGQYDPNKYYPRGLALNTVMEIIEKGFGQYYIDHYATDPFMFSDAYIAAHPEIIQQRAESAKDGTPALKPYLRHVIARQEHETTALLPQITTPTLVIHGDADKESGGVEGASHIDSALTLARGIAGSEYKTFPGRHGYLWESNEQVNPFILQFFRKHDPLDMAPAAASAVGSRRSTNAE